MGIIDLNVEKPAWKRTEVVGAEAETESVEDAPAAETEAESDEEAGESTVESDGESRGRLPRAARLVGGLAVSVVALLALRKFRGRRSGSEQTPAEPTE